MPPHYDPRRQYDRPIPSLNASVTSDATDTDEIAGVSGANDQQSFNDETNNDFEADTDSDLTENAHSTDVNNTAPAIPSLNTSSTSDASDMSANVGVSAEMNNDVEADVDNELTENAHSTDINDTVPAILSLNASDASDVGVNAGTNNDVEADVENELTENDHDENSIVGNEQNIIVPELNGVDINSGESNIIADSESDIHVSQSTHDVETDFKQILQPVSMHADDEAAIRNLYGDLGKSIEANDDPPANPFGTISLGCGETAEIKDGKIVVTRKLDDSFEMEYIYGETPTPHDPQYVVKINDPLSGNIPFKENVKKDRAYSVRINGVFEEVKMASLLVNGLKYMNDGNYRKQSTLDHAFVKMLIIGLCTKDAIKNGEQIHKDLKIFMKGSNIFVNRIFLMNR